MTDIDEVFNPNAVKVVLNRGNYALYFSRAPIPWDRENFVNGGVRESTTAPFLRHIGMYAYSVAFLKRYIGWEASQLEQIECLEQLRILWHGESIIVATVTEIPEPGVDTEQDIHRVEQVLLKNR